MDIWEGKKCTESDILWPHCPPCHLWTMRSTNSKIYNHSQRMVKCKLSCKMCNKEISAVAVAQWLITLHFRLFKASHIHLSKAQRLSEMLSNVYLKKKIKCSFFFFFITFSTWCISKTLWLAFFPLAIAEIKLHLNCSCNSFVVVWWNFKYDVCL